jgi:hypothetical protein
MAVLGKINRFAAVVLGFSLIIGCGSGTTDSGEKDGSGNQELPPEAPKDGSRNERIRYMRGDSDPQPTPRTEEGKTAAARAIDPSAK